MFIHHLSKFDKFSLKIGGEIIFQSWLLLTPFFSLTIVQWVDGFSWRYSTRCLSGVGTMIHLPCTVWLIGIHYRYVSKILPSHSIGKRGWIYWIWPGWGSRRPDQCMLNTCLGNLPISIQQTSITTNSLCLMLFFSSG